MPRKKYSTAPKTGKKKPRLEWRVEITDVDGLRDTLQMLTDESWRVFSQNVHSPTLIVVSAYMSKWGAPDDEDDKS